MYVIDILRKKKGTKYIYIYTFYILDGELFINNFYPDEVTEHKG